MENSLRLIFSSIAVISALLFLGLITLLHFLPNKYNPAINTVSDYAAAPAGWQQAFMAVALPLAGAGSSLSLAVAMAAGVKTVSMQIILFLVISSIGRFFLVFFPTDVTGEPVTKIGRIHLVCAIIAFSGIALAAGSFHLTATDKILGQTVVAATVLLLLGFFLSPLKKIFGLLERLSLFSSVIWLVVVGVELFCKG
jgi:hypothetical protein